MIEIGKINRLKVVRQSDLGYMLSDGEKEILMHYKQAAKVLEKDEMVDVYIYTDKENRPTATMHPTVLQMGKPAFATVVQVLPGIGVFVTIKHRKIYWFPKTICRMMNSVGRKWAIGCFWNLK